MSQIAFFERDLGGARVVPPNVAITPERYSWRAAGGPHMASLLVTGSEAALFNLTRLLRCPVTIYDAHERAVWWGYVAELQIRGKAIQYGVTLDEMANRVRVTYSDKGDTATQQTGWAEDTDSSGEYGDKELIVPAPLERDVSTAEAEELRDTVLAARKYPVPQLDLAPLRGDASARIYCRGWWSVLAWKYFAATVGLDEYIHNHNDALGFGQSTQTKAAVQFTSPYAAVEAHRLTVNLKKVNNPPGDVEFHIYSDSAGSPNTSLGSGTITETDISDTSWDTFTVDLGGIALSASTAYWIVAETTATHASDVYHWALNTDSTTQTNKRFVGAWAALATAGDLYYSLTYTRAQDAQIETMLTLDGTSDFFSTVDDEVASTTQFLMYRDGSRTVREEVEELLAAGTTNDRRILATVNEDRTVRLYEEPAAGAADWRVTRAGEWEDAYGAPVPRSVCPVARWVSVIDVVPQGTSASLLADPLAVFVEENEFDVRAGNLLPRARYTPDPWKV